MEETIKASGFRRIKVIGIGGGGYSAVSYMIERGMRDVDYIVVDAKDQLPQEIPSLN